MASAQGFTSSTWNSVYKDPDVDSDCYYALIYGDIIYTHVLPTGAKGGSGAGYGQIYPDTISDSVQPRWSAQDILNRPGKLPYFSGSGDRTCSFSFTLHNEAYTHISSTSQVAKKTEYKKWESTIKDLRRGCLAYYTNSGVQYPPIVVFKFGRFRIKGYMTQCNFTWKKPIDWNDSYQQCEVSVTITDIPPTTAGAETYPKPKASPLNPYGRSF